MSGLRRVWVTGIGLVSPLAGQREATWQGLLAGQRALRSLSFEDTSLGTWPERIAGAPAILADGWLMRFQDHARRCGAIDADLLDAVATEPVISLACAAASEAIDDAQLELAHCDHDRIGCVVGTSKGGLRTMARRSRPESDDEPTSACDWPASWSNGPAMCLSRSFNLRGPLLSPVTACATGLSSIVRAVELIRDGTCDVVLAGSSDASLTPSMLASFRRLGVLAKGDVDPAEAVRPFDRQRSGFLIGEGAAIFILESAEHALARQRSAYAEWLSGGALSDATGLTQLSPDPAALIRLIRDTLCRGGLTPEDVDYISLHGTATLSNDDVEARAIQQAFGTAAGRLSCSSLKGAIGHLLGAAGSVEFAATLMAVRDGIVAPTVNLRDPEFELDFVPHVARQRRVDVALKLSLGFGGHLVAGLVGKPR